MKGFLIMDKTTLLKKLNDNRTLFERLVSQVSPDNMIHPSGEDNESGKDIIAHLTTWEQRFIRWLNRVSQGEIPDYENPEPGFSWDNMHEMNAQTHIQNKDRSLAEIQSDSQHSFRQLLDQINAFSDEELTIPRPFAWSWQDDTPESGR